MPKKSHKPVIIIILLIVIVAIIGGFYYTIFSSKKSSSASPDTDLTKVIQNQNADKFLTMFDSDSTKSSISKIGAKSILLDWNQNSTEDISKISSTLKKNGKFSGAENDYRIKYEETTKLMFIKQSKLTTMTSKLIVPNKLKKASIKVDGERVSYSELTTNNLFPGVYNFKIKLGKAESSQKVTVLGDGRSNTLKVPEKKKSVPQSNTSNAKKQSNDTSKTKQSESKNESANDASSANNDPEYREPSMVNADNLEGYWKLVDSKNDEGLLPEAITFTRDNITVMYTSDLQSSMAIDTVRYSDTDDTNYFTGEDSPNPFAAKLVKKTINGEQRVVMEHLDQGAYGWYIRQ